MSIQGVDEGIDDGVEGGGATSGAPRACPKDAAATTTEAVITLAIRMDPLSPAASGLQHRPRNPSPKAAGACSGGTFSPGSIPAVQARPAFVGVPQPEGRLGLTDLTRQGRRPALREAAGCGAQVVPARGARARTESRTPAPAQRPRRTPTATRGQPTPPRQWRNGRPARSAATAGGVRLFVLSVSPPRRASGDRAAG